MYALVHQYATSVDIPRTTPCPGVVISLTSLPFQGCFHHHNTTKTSFIKRLSYQQRSVIESVLEDSTDQAALSSPFPDYPLGFLFIYLNRLLNKDMLTGLKCRNRRLFMKTRGSRNKHNLNFFIGQKGFQIRICDTAVFFSVLFTLGWFGTVYSPQETMLAPFKCIGMGGSNITKPYDSKSNLSLHTKSPHRGYSLS